MGLVIAGIDEAGYGPLLGPMCVGLAVMRVDSWNEGDPAPDLWKRLSPAVSRELKQRKRASGAIPIADSKKLKLPNDVARGHPLMHLERGVLAMMGVMDVMGMVDPSGAAPAGIPLDDGAFFKRLGARHDGHECYANGAAALPLAWSSDQLSIAANVLRGAVEQSGVTPCALACDVTPEPEFNEIVRRRGTKAAVTLRSIARHLRSVWQRWGSGPDSVRLVCDRLGGRTRYARVLQRIASRLDPAAQVQTVRETERCSRYMIEGPTGRMGVSFEVEGEQAHLPVALASMVAKYTRELAMGRFNRYWTARLVAAGFEVKPTAGYTQDGRRWLHDAAGVLTAEDRRMLVRVV